MSGSGHNPRTQVCELTAAGRSAISVVGVRGPAAVEVVDRHFQSASGRPLAEHPVSRIVYGHWGGASVEDLVVCRRSPEEVEVHCHGGSQSVARVIQALVGAGCRQVEWKQWVVQRSDCPLMAEAQMALAEAVTGRTASILLAQYQGALRRELEAIRALLQEDTLNDATQRIEQLLCWSEFGLHLAQPWRVVIAGPPNVGKSSLINALVGYQRAIVFDQPGTTRDVVSATTAVDGWPVQLSDTAGLHPCEDSVEAAGIALAQERIRSADFTVWLLDATQLDDQETRSAQEITAAQSLGVAVPLDFERTLVVVNKTDLAAPPKLLRGEFLSVSAATSAGIPDLILALADRLVPKVPAANTAIPFTERQKGLLNRIVQYCQASCLFDARTTLDRLFSSEKQH